MGDRHVVGESWEGVGDTEDQGEPHAGTGFPKMELHVSSGCKAVPNLISSCLLTESPTLFSILVGLFDISLWAQSPDSFHRRSQAGRPYEACCPGILEAGPHVLSGRFPDDDVEGGGREELLLGFASEQRGAVLIEKGVGRVLEKPHHVWSRA